MKTSATFVMSAFLFVSVRDAKATQYVPFETPGAACQPVEDEYDIGHQQQGVWNRSNVTTEVYCPLQLDNRGRNNSVYSPTVVNTVWIDYYDGANGSGTGKDIICSAYALGHSGSLTQSANQISSGSGAGNFFFVPFGTLDLSSDLFAVGIRCTFPSAQSVQSAIYNYEFNLKYPNAPNP